LVYSQKNPEVIEKREKLFSKFERVYSLINYTKIKRFFLFIKKMSEIIISAEKAVEIGFGQGNEFINFLKSGANIYGIDLSEEAILNFKRKYPEYSMRVICDTSINFPVNVIYSNALFEHLDNPGGFLNNAFSTLNSGGFLIMQLPLIAFENAINGKLYSDINFWKPCHRVLYSTKGLNLLFNRHGFRIIEMASLDYYGYKVMNRMLELGYKDIEHVRNPFFKIKGLDSNSVYKKILLQSFFKKSTCLDFALIAKKIE